MNIKIGIILSFYILTLSSCLRDKSVLNNTEYIEIENYNNLNFALLDTSVMTAFFYEEKKEHVLVEKGYYVWGLSVISWEGKYHAYYSRWKKKYAHKGWMTHCEIAHAVSSKPEGPFRFVNVVLDAKKNSGWDINNSHNPFTIVVDGQICLYYISNDIKPLLEEDSTNMTYPDSAWFTNNRKRLRNSQRIGVAIADNPSGPFVRSEKPLVEPDNVTFKNIAVNPSVVYHDDTYTMIIKGDDVAKKKWYRIQLVGQSSSAKGPFEFSSKPVYDKAQTEDACMWFDKVLNKYYMVCHMMRKPDLALFNSENGTDWQLDQRGVFMKKEFMLADSTIWKPERVERPFVLTNEKGQPIMVYVAVADKNVNGNIAIPIEIKKK